MDFRKFDSILKESCAQAKANAILADIGVAAGRRFHAARAYRPMSSPRVKVRSHVGALQATAGAGLCWVGN